MPGIHQCRKRKNTRCHHIHHPCHHVQPFTKEGVTSGHLAQPEPRR